MFGGGRRTGRRFATKKLNGRDCIRGLHLELKISLGAPTSILGANTMCETKLFSCSLQEY